MSEHPPRAVIDAHGEIASWLLWLDAIRGPYVVLLVAMVAVAAGAGWSIATEQTPPALAWMNGIAAVMTAAAALAETRRGSDLRDKIEDHEVRIRVMESNS